MRTEEDRDAVFGDRRSCQACLLHLIHQATGVLRNKILCLGRAAPPVQMGTKQWKNLWHRDNPHEPLAGNAMADLPATAARSALAAAASTPSPHKCTRRKHRSGLSPSGSEAPAPEAQEEGCREMLVLRSTHHPAWFSVQTSTCSLCSGRSQGWRPVKFREEGKGSGEVGRGVSPHSFTHP